MQLFEAFSVRDIRARCTKAFQMEKPMRTWSVGDVTISQIVEQVMPEGIPGLIPNATREALRAIPWLYPEFITEAGDASLSLHALVVDTPTKRILVDTCIGNDKQLEIAPFWHNLQTDFLEKMEAHGFNPGSIDVVVCTHLHLDHVGWNTRKTAVGWTATFPNARYLIAKTEYSAMKAAQSDPAAEEDWRQTTIVVDRESIQPVVDAGLVDFVEMDHRITPEVWLRPTVGHSPGHVSVIIESRGAKAIITGDATHHPCQLVHPEWASHVDADEAASTATRWEMFDEAESTGRFMLGTHWTGAGGGLVVRDGASYRLDIEASTSPVVRQDTVS
jgi:glyoxylase-like metal-dependent hydrolase (beta-lactamase superfamily II)